MSQAYDETVASDSLSTGRGKIVGSLNALLTSSSGTSAPAAPAAGYREGLIWWFDTNTTGHASKGYIKLRNTADSAWIKYGYLDQAPIEHVEGTIRQADADSIMFSAPHDCTIVAIKLVLSKATSSNGSNYYTMQVVNATQTLDLLATAKSTNGADFTADTTYDLGVDQNLDVDEDDVLRFDISATGSPTTISSADFRYRIDYVIR